MKNILMSCLLTVGFVSSHAQDRCLPNKPNGTQDPPGIGAPMGAIVGTEIVFTKDPNIIIGPDGVQTKKWVAAKDRMPYQVLFENDTTATAPVKVVKVVLPIDPKQDPNTFQLSSFGFNNLTFNVPNGPNSYYQRLDARDSLGLFVDVTAGYDAVNKQAFWIFESIDPITQLPTKDPLKGFLSKRSATNTNAGHGFVNFSIKPLPSVKTGDTSSAYASIVFDANDTVPTNRAKNTIDALPPTSHLNATVQYTGPTTFKLNWNGNDDAGGSGLASYSLYMSVNNGPYSLYRSGMTETSMLFTGLHDSTYCFFLSAKDSVNNEEALKNTCELSVTVPGTVLPLTWLDFTGVRRGDDALLNWSTTNEVNARLFVVERSLNGTEFNGIGNVNAKATSGVNNYSFTDAGINRLGVKVIYYRIKQVDNNGQFTYSKIVAIRVDDAMNDPLVSVFPNPFNQFITLKVIPVTAQDKTSSVELYSLQGVLLYRKDISKQGAVILTLNDLPNLASGMYILKTTVNGIPYTTKLVKD